MAWSLREQRRQERADLVYSALQSLTAAHPPSPGHVTVFTPGQVAGEAGVSVAQAREAVEDLRERPDLDDAIVTILGPGGGWAVTREEGVVRWFMRWRTQQAHTLMRRTYYGAVRPFLTRVLAPSQPDAARQIAGAFETALDKLADALAV